MERAAHPGLVPCRRFFRDSGAGILGLVFDFIRGLSLFDALGDLRMTPTHRRAVLDQLADTLAYVHAHGMVHRDLKSPNILITDGFWGAPHVAGGVKLVDFGIAAPTGNPRPVTVHGQEIGTPAYMAPELLFSGPWTEHTEGFARDMFAFGVLACEIFDGTHPTGLPWNAPARDFANAYRAIAAERRRWPPPGAFGPSYSVVRSCLALDPRRRPEGGAALVQLLRSGSASPAVPSPGPARAPMTTPHQHATDPPRSVAWPGGVIPMSGSVPAGTNLRAPITEDAPPSARSSGTLRALGLVLLVGVAAVGGAVLYATCTAPSPAVPVTLAVAPVQPNFVPGPVNPPVTEALLDAPCPEGRASCQSGRVCTRGLAKVRIPERPWWLRVSGVAGRTAVGFGEDMGNTHPTAMVCLRLISPAAPPVCVPFSDMIKDGGARVHASSRDDLRSRAGEHRHPDQRVWRRPDVRQQRSLPGRSHDDGALRWHAPLHRR